MDKIKKSKGGRNGFNNLGQKMNLLNFLNGVFLVTFLRAQKKIQNIDFAFIVPALKIKLTYSKLFCVTKTISLNVLSKPGGGVHLYQITINFIRYNLKFN